jgi:hypothetical protein
MYIMATKFQITPDGLIVTTVSKNGVESIQRMEYEKECSLETVGRVLLQDSKAAPSMRQASLVFISTLQQRGEIKEYFSSGKVTTELLKAMRASEEKLVKELNLGDEVLANMRKAGVYADTRSHALKAWCNGFAIKQGNDQLLTTSALRSINLTFNKPKEAKTLEAIMEELKEYCESHPSDISIAMAQFNAVMSAAREHLDAVTKANEILTRDIEALSSTVELDTREMTEEEIDAEIAELISQGYIEETVEEVKETEEESAPF